ncbi:hypothetical protein EIC82_17835 [Enterobacter sp. A11]|uniref:beta family protein n=1 Tax=unclassified Enterobacter TaxID=2608935 RepID=UPI00106FD37B|nr:MULTISPECIES: beta family protein [unclassified Enterobacter]MBM1023156.1 beta family protein [Enterobacter sp. E1]MEA3564478.1 beta family protein [Enterobacter sp. GM-22]MEA3598152.1 beta family protein [Enterobacter sp. GM-31]TFF55607.1 hypothetical protein EIC82_17835 [Enterobacter sp. A11]
MYPTYVPILKAKKGEFTALKKLKAAYSEKIAPFFEIPILVRKQKEPKWLVESTQPLTDHLKRTAKKLVSSCQSNAFFFDITQWKADSYIETGEHVLSYLHKELSKSGAIIHPVVGFDRWDILDYQIALKNLNIPDGTNYCIRIDSSSIIDDSYDVDYFTGTLEKIMEDLGLSSKEVMIMLDFDDITNKSIESLNDHVKHVLNIFSDYEFSCIIISGGSFPAFINKAVKDENSTDYVTRREIHVWKSFVDDSTSPLIFSDYGIRNPKAKDDVIAPNANGKIRYTIDDKYFVVRGYAKNKDEEYKQLHGLSEILVKSPHYLGPDFSWGDECILACSKKEILGGNTEWVSHDTNHHISYVVEEITEFNRVRAAKKTAII